MALTTLAAVFVAWLWLRRGLQAKVARVEACEKAVVRYRVRSSIPWSMHGGTRCCDTTIPDQTLHTD